MKAKRILALALAVLMVAVMVPFTFATATEATESESLVAGGECNSADDAAHWFFRDGGAAVNFVAGGGPDGSGCIEIVPTSGGNMYYRDEAGNNAQGVALPYGEDYKISMDILCPTDLAYTGGFWIDGENWDVFSHGCGVTDLDKTGAGEWRHVEYELNDCPVTTYDLRVVLYNFTSFGTSTIKIDNIKIVCTSDATLTRAKIHGSILRSGDLDSPVYSKSDWYNANAKSMKHVSNIGVNGSGALRVTCGTSDGSIIKWGEGGNIYSGVKVEPETTYKYSCDLYLEDEMVGGSSYILDFENVGYFELCKGDLTKVGEWQHLEGFFYSGDYDNTNGKQLWCRTGVVGGGNDGKHYVVDNISINPVNRAVYVADPIPPLSIGGNLIAGGNFESAEDVAHLRFRDSADQVIYNATGGVDGSGCAEIVASAGGNIYYFDTPSFFGPDKYCHGVAMPTGKDYRISMDIWCPTDLAYSGGFWIDAENFNMFEQGGPGVGELDKEDAGTWRHVEYYLTNNPVDSYNLRIVLYNFTNFGSSHIKIDNLEVVCINDSSVTHDSVHASVMRSGEFNSRCYSMLDWYNANAKSFEYVENGGVNGGGALRVTCGTSDGSIIKWGEGGNIYSGVNVASTTIYKLSADLYLEDEMTGSFILDFENAGYYERVKGDLSKVGEWQHLEGYVYTNEYDNTNGKQLWLRFGVVGSGNDGKHYIMDNVSLSPVSKAVSVAAQVGPDAWSRNLVRSGAFENEAYTFMDWFSHGGYGGAILDWSADGGVNGSGCAVLNTTGAGDAGCMMYHFNNTANWGITLTEGHVYLFECDVFRPAESTMTVRLDMEGGEAFGCPYTAAATANGEWEHLSVMFTSQKSATDAPLRFLLEGDKSGNMVEGKSVKVDNMSVRELNGPAPIEGTYGDVNADGSINLKDLVRIKKYLAQMLGITLDEEAADVNIDGVVSAVDVVRLKKYFAAYNYTTSASTVPLGF